jgi:hypothetical protein
MRSHEAKEDLRIRLRSESLLDFKSRALARKNALGEYADMIFRYLWLEKMVVRMMYPTMEESEEVYIAVQVPPTTRRRLAEASEKQRVNLASLSGSMIRTFLEEHEHDPRDLSLVHYASLRVDEKGVIAESELKLAIGRCEQNPNLRLPAGYFARWLAGRLGSLIKEIDRAGERVPLTVSVMEDLLESERHS